MTKRTPLDSSVEFTSSRMSSIAAKGLRNPHQLTTIEMRALAACVLTQARDHRAVSMVRTREGWKPNADPKAASSS